MNKNVAALLGIGHAQPTNFGPIVSRNVKQSSVADLAAHLRVKSCLIQNNIEFVWFFAWHDSFHNGFGLEKVVSEKFCGRSSKLSFNRDRFFLLGLARTLALLLHE